MLYSVGVQVDCNAHCLVKEPRHLTKIDINATSLDKHVLHSDDGNCTSAGANAYAPMSRNWAG
jgi:hypothetical protein